MAKNVHGIGIRRGRRVKRPPARNRVTRAVGEYSCDWQRSTTAPPAALLPSSYPHHRSSSRRNLPQRGDSAKIIPLSFIWQRRGDEEGEGVSRLGSRDGSREGGPPRAASLSVSCDCGRGTRAEGGARGGQISPFAHTPPPARDAQSGIRSGRRCELDPEREDVTRFVPDHRRPGTTRVI
jgi:hypothetical protein